MKLLFFAKQIKTTLADNDNGFSTGAHFRNFLFGFLFLLGACSDPLDPVGLMPGNGGLYFQINPAWYDDNILLIENIGVVAFGPSWISIQELSAGVIKWDISTGISEVLVPSGLFPSANQARVFSCISQDQGGAIVLGNDEGQRVIEEEVLWPKRVGLTINSSGALLAWVALSTEPAKGVWILDTNTMEYTFVGLGFSPAWHPVEDKLLFRYENAGQNALVATFDFSTSLTDTIFSFSAGGGRNFSYSPSGNQIAYFGSGDHPDEFGVYVFDVISGEAQQINQHSGVGLCWGERGIVYSNQSGDMDNLGSGVLWIIDTETWESQQLTERYQFISEEDTTRFSQEQAYLPHVDASQNQALIQRGCQSYSSQSGAASQNPGLR